MFFKISWFLSRLHLIFIKFQSLNKIYSNYDSSLINQYEPELYMILMEIATFWTGYIIFEKSHPNDIFPSSFTHYFIQTELIN